MCVDECPLVFILLCPTILYSVVCLVCPVAVCPVIVSIGVNPAVLYLVVVLLCM